MLVIFSSSRSCAREFRIEIIDFVAFSFICTSRDHQSGRYTATVKSCRLYLSHPRRRQSPAPLPGHRFARPEKIAACTLDQDQIASVQSTARRKGTY